VRLLLQNGADIEAKMVTAVTALDLAAKNGHDAVVRLLIENGANFKAKVVSEGTARVWQPRTGRRGGAAASNEGGQHQGED
jgi:ankyrin repeat protein